MQSICMVTASYTLGFLMTEKPWLVFRMKHKMSKQKFFVIPFMEQFHNMEKILILLFSYSYFFAL